MGIVDPGHGRVESFVPRFIEVCALGFHHPEPARTRTAAIGQRDLARFQSNELENLRAELRRKLE